MRQFNQRVPTSATAGTMLRAVIVTNLMVNMSTYLTVTIRDKNGEVTKHYHRRCHSFVKQMLQLLEVHHRGVGIANILDTSNTARTVVSSTNHFKIEGGIGIVTKGIVVGS